MFSVIGLLQNEFNAIQVPVNIGARNYIENLAEQGIDIDVP
jgi:hypothetical protein